MHRYSIILLLIALLFNQTFASNTDAATPTKTCTCTTKSYDIREKTETVMVHNKPTAQTKYCAFITVDALCMDNNESGTIELSCYSTKAKAENDIKTYDKDFKCWYKNDQLYTKNPDFFSNIAGPLLFLFLVVCSVVCCVFCCLVGGAAIGVSLLFLTRQEGFMRTMTNFFSRFSSVEILSPAP